MKRSETTNSEEEGDKVLGVAFWRDLQIYCSLAGCYHGCLSQWVHIAKLQGYVFNNTMPIEKPYKRFSRPSTNKSLITAVPFGGIVLLFFYCTDESSTSLMEKVTPACLAVRCPSCLLLFFFDIIKSWSGLDLNTLWS